MPLKSNLVEPSLVELGAREVLDNLKKKGLLSGNDEKTLLDTPEKVQTAIKSAVSELLAGMPIQDDFFEHSTTTEFYRKVVLHKGELHVLSNQIQQFVDSLIVSRDIILERKFVVLKTAIDRAKISWSDDDIKLRIERAKSIITYSVAPLIDIQKGKGFMQVMDDLWGSKGGQELRSIFISEKLYHMFMDLAEFFMKRQLPRLVVSGQRFKKNIHHARRKKSLV